MTIVCFLLHAGCRDSKPSHFVFSLIILYCFTMLPTFNLYRDDTHFNDLISPARVEVRNDRPIFS